MSFHVSSICSKRKLGGSSRKQVLMFLADKASDDGSGIWCSKATIALETELSRSTVKRLLKEFEAEGLIIASGHRKNTHGYTVEYAINLNAISTLPPLKEDLKATEAMANPVQNEPSKEPTVNCQDSSACTPNHPPTIQEPPSREREATEAEMAELFELAWNTYPNDRRRNRSECAKHFRAAIEKGAKPEAITRAIQNYAETSRDYTRSKVKFSDNWFRNIDWHQFIEQEAIEANNLDDAMRRSLDLCVDWINKGSSQCTYITTNQLAALLEAGRITNQQLVRVGLDQKLEELRYGQN